MADSDEQRNINHNALTPSPLADGAAPFPGPGVFRFEHTAAPEAALLLERDGGLLITCDSVQHWAPSKLMSPVAKVLTSPRGFRQSAPIGPLWRHGGLLDRDAKGVLRASVARNVGG